jgi:3-dehydroquinate dehydratase-2
MNQHARACNPARGSLAMAKPIFVLNGPNLNMLGLRETTVYGEDTLADIESRLQAAAGPLNLTIDFRQSNSEGELVGWIQDARDAASGLILNAAAYTHTSVALLDAVRAAELPTIEVHLSNVFQRENFRHRSYISQAATGVICGLGATGYVLALQALAEHIER